MATVPQVYEITAPDESSMLALRDVQVSDVSPLPATTVPLHNVILVDPIKKSVEMISRSSIQMMFPNVAVRSSSLRTLPEHQEVPNESDEKSTDEPNHSKLAALKSKIVRVGKAVTHKLYHKNNKGRYFLGFTLYNWCLYNFLHHSYSLYSLLLFISVFFTLFISFIYVIFSGYFIGMLYLSAKFGNWEMFYPSFQPALSLMYPNTTSNSTTM